jgi:hypothetical protein
LGPFSLRVAKNDPTIVGRLSRKVMKRFTPKRQHLVELTTTHNNRTDLHTQRLTIPSRAAFVAMDKIESNGAHRGIKQRAVVDLVVSPPELDERFLDDVFGIGR